MSRATRNPFFWILMVALSLLFIGPILFVLLTSLKPMIEAQSVPPTIVPETWTLRAYEQLFFIDDASPVLRWFLNSLAAATMHAILVVTVCSLAGYALARMQFRGKNVVFAIIISTMLVPGFVFLIPNFEMLNRLAWLDSLAAIVVPGAAGAFGVFFMRQFFLKLPIEFEESARIDGAGPLRTFVSVVLPNTRAALVTLFIISFLANWNDFIWPIYVLFSDSNLTLPVGLSRLQGAYTIDYPVVMAGAMVAAIPVLFIYAFVQRYIIAGVASSGLKG
ncbi:carbohydrate ABC transporter permease [Tessaracoccus rhinocerotis]|uniref:Carbohydrate ABC transporter permease n=1 Tax=Tessaracoccus rhinocerotis TaxID=1689449 RepID=A0A553K4P2_9ACTN|nr:carbohydrate ABC transporter permease [Tessaracoccus rhinocerotis]TRY19678.1 carbohydrate ABC transporter permease [Tessaracoccus rhinocerotis]